MDITEKEILSAYADKIGDIIIHLIDNKTLNLQDRCHFMQHMGSGMFKAAHCLFNEVHQDSLDDHAIMLVPNDLLEKAKSSLKIIQDEHLQDQLKNKLSRAKSRREEAELIAKYHEAKAKSDKTLSRVMT